MNELNKDQNIEYTLNALNSLVVSYLNPIIDSASESDLPCPIDCCIGNDVPSLISPIFEEFADDAEKIIGISGLEMLKEFNKALDCACCNEIEWQEFRSLAIKLKSFIQQVKVNVENAQFQI